MASLFIANTSKQHHDFAYRLPEEQNIRYETIRAGSQARIGGDLQRETIDRIIKQHTAYGLKDVSDLPRNSAFVGLCFSIDKPVSFDTIMETFEQNDTAMNERAEDRREDVAAAISSEMQATLNANGASVQRTEVETVEDTKGTPAVASGYETVADGVEPKRGSKLSLKSRGH